MKTVLLPVKDFRYAKQRLSSALDARSRAELSRAMLSDVLEVLGGARVPERVVVFTSSDDIVQMAERFGFEVIRENSIQGHSTAVNHMVRELSSSSSRILSMAADLPKLLPEEIDFILNMATQPITIIPSRDGTGTNGVVFNPPACIAMEYGEGSFRRHLSKAAAAGFAADVLNVPGMAFDIDTPEDLETFLNDPRRDSQTWHYLMSLR